MSSPTSEVNTASFCAGCGTSLLADVRFCPKCGAAVNTANTQANAPLLSAAISATLPTDEIAELERIAGEHPEDESYQKLLAVQLHDDAMKDWWKDPKDGQFLCTSFQQIQHARTQLTRAAALRFHDPQLRADLEKLRKLADDMEQRQYTGNWLQIVILGLFWIFPGVIWWYVNRRPAFLINRDYVREIQTGKHPGAGAKMGGAMEKVSNFFDSITEGWGWIFSLIFMVVFSPVFMILAYKQNYLDVKREYDIS
ncbi:MAG TPA: zinc ribbon domain-containing protein [Acidobacteriaceae bacterium]|jgi:hypothetical protein|nr:zinc ribbon domain-containing protein [Acidobacteriaceae bacterium]